MGLTHTAMNRRLVINITNNLRLAFCYNFPVSVGNKMLWTVHTLKREMVWEPFVFPSNELAGS